MPSRPTELSARTWLVSGHVQGVGFRWFASRRAQEIGVAGWAQNLDDGRVQVYATGTEDQLNTFAAWLHKGPAHAAVRGVEEHAAPVQQLSSFQTR